LNAILRAVAAAKGLDQATLLARLR